MAKRMPPVPPAGRSPKGPGAAPQTEPKTADPADAPPQNLAEQGCQGNIKQNTTNQGYQQDR